MKLKLDSGINEISGYINSDKYNNLYFVYTFEDNSFDIIDNGKLYECEDLDLIKSVKKAIIKDFKEKIKILSFIDKLDNKQNK